MKSAIFEKKTKQKQPSKKVFWKIAVGILKDNSQLLEIWTKSNGKNKKLIFQ